MNATQTNLFTVQLNLTGKAGSEHVEPVRVSNAKEMSRNAIIAKFGQGMFSQDKAGESMMPVQHLDTGNTT